MNKVATEKNAMYLIPLDELRAMEIPKLEEMIHTLSADNNRQASKQIDLLKGIIKGKTPKPGKAPAKEPVVNSRKPTPAKPKTVTPKGTAAKAPKSETAKTTTPKPPKPSPPKPTTTPKTAKAGKELGVSEKLAETFETDNTVFERINVGSIEELGLLLYENPYSIYMFLVEGGHGDATRFNVVYASSELLLFVDKSNELETFLTSHTEKSIKDLIKNSHYIEEGTPAKEAYPLAFYHAHKKTE